MERKVGGWHDDPCRARWGCFLPDLTRLASGSSTTNLPSAHIGNSETNCKPRLEKTAKTEKNDGRVPLHTFTLDERLARDSDLLIRLGLCELRLMRDSRWPWLVLVPQRGGVSEVFDLTPLDQAMLTFEQNTVAAMLKNVSGATKINVAAIGNVVRQLHVHVIARFEGDPNWPGPVWGYQQAIPYAADDQDALTQKLLKALES